jgi:hypothetical protein
LAHNSSWIIYSPFHFFILNKKKEKKKSESEKERLRDLLPYGIADIHHTSFIQMERSRWRRWMGNLIWNGVERSIYPWACNASTAIRIAGIRISPWPPVASSSPATSSYFSLLSTCRGLASYRL